VESNGFIKPVSPPIKTVIVGAGSIAEEHVQSLARIPQAQIVAVCDLDIQRAAKLASRFGIPGVFTSVGEMIEREKPDVAHVLTQPQNHVSVALECVNAGCHVFVEKPLGVSVRSCHELKSAAERRRVHVGVNHNVVFRPAFQELIELIRSRRMGRVHHVSVCFSLSPKSVNFQDPRLFMFQRPDSVVFELGPHPFSLVRRLMGGPQEATAICSSEMRVAGGKSFFACWHTTWRSERGTAQVYLSAGIGHPDATVAVYGEDAVAYADIMRHSVRLAENIDRPIHGQLYQDLQNAGARIRGAFLPVLSRFGKAIRRPEHPGLHSMLSSITSFYDALAKGVKPPESIDEAIQVVNYCEMTQTAARTNGNALKASIDGRGGL